METSSGWLPDGRGLSVWGVSIAVHAVILGLLGFFHFEVSNMVTTVIDSAFDSETPEENFKFDATATDQIGSGGELSGGPSSLAVSQAAVASSVKSTEEQVDRTIGESIDVRAPASTEAVVGRPQQNEMLAPVQTTGGTVQAGGVEGAIDRISYELMNQLREKKTLVVWLFDVSPSLSKRRAQIADRVENIYNQLNQLNVTSDKALKTAIATFGERFTPVTADPLDDIEEVVKAVRSIKSEESGKENVFAAVLGAVKKWQTFRTKQQRAVTIVIVTDEAGSDAEQYLEQAIVETKKYGMKCFVIGEGAPLGRKQVESMFTLDSGETVIGVMDRGPESYFQERLRLSFWGVNGYDLDAIPSGFGPYGLTRLCAETNGLYLVSDIDNKFPIDPIVMRSYPPDYRPIPILDKDIRSNRAKQAIFDVCKKYQVESLPIPTTRFPAENDTVLRQNIGDAQKPLAELDYKLDEILRVLEGGEKDRAKIQEPRWRAIYDLNVGRVLAMRVRSYGYNMMLAEMKAAPKRFEKKESNLWTLQPSKDITSGPASKKMATKAQEYLKRVIDEHAGTPWAILAEREYSTQMGWEWKEGYYNPQPQNMANGKEKRAPRFAEETDPKTGKKTKRQLPDEPVRREI